MNTPEEFWFCVDRENYGDCWIWKGKLHVQSKHGSLRWKGRTTYAHRVAYELVHGPIRRGRVVHHSCRDRLCVRPEHLSLRPPDSFLREHELEKRCEELEAENEQLRKRLCRLLERVEEYKITGQAVMN